MSKNKGGREAKKPKQTKVAKSASSGSPVSDLEARRPAPTKSRG